MNKRPLNDNKDYNDVGTGSDGNDDEARVDHDDEDDDDDVVVIASVVRSAS